MKGKYIEWDRGIGYFHDDYYSDGNIRIPDFPMKRVFGDFRIFNGLPLEVVDQYIGKIIDIFIELDKDHQKYKDYWENHTRIHYIATTQEEPEK